MMDEKKAIQYFFEVLYLIQEKLLKIKEKTL